MSKSRREEEMPKEKEGKWINKQSTSTKNMYKYRKSTFCVNDDVRN